MTVRSGGQAMRAIVGPATYEKEQWVLPVFWFYFDPETDITEIKAHPAEMRESWGLEGRERVRKVKYPLPDLTGDQAMAA